MVLCPWLFALLNVCGNDIMLCCLVKICCILVGAMFLWYLTVMAVISRLVSSHLGKYIALVAFIADDCKYHIDYNTIWLWLVLGLWLLTIAFYVSSNFESREYVGCKPLSNVHFVLICFFMWRLWSWFVMSFVHAGPYRMLVLASSFINCDGSGYLQTCKSGPIWTLLCLSLTAQLFYHEYLMRYILLYWIRCLDGLIGLEIMVDDDVDGWILHLALLFLVFDSW